MNIEKIEIQPGQWVWVDKDAEIKEGDHLCCWELGLTNNPKWKIYQSRNPKFERLVDKTYKIIAASPELELEGVPDYVELLAEQEYPLIDESWCTTGDVHEENLQLLGHRRTYIKGYKTAKQEIKNDSWLSPIDTERKWQEEKLVEIFYHYPNASPAWQYMNGLIHIALESKNKFTEEDLKKAIELTIQYERKLRTFPQPEQIIEQIKYEQKI